MRALRARLRARWVVLTACNSAVEDGLVGAEALSGLARAFVDAGAGGVIVSYWPVNDTSSTYLMRGLFERWAVGGAMSEALRETMLDMRQSPFDHRKYRSFATPVHWAPFVIVGQ